MVPRWVVVLVAGMLLVGVPAIAFSGTSQCERIDFVYDGVRWLPAIPDRVPHVDVANSSARGLVLGYGGVTDLKSLNGIATLQFAFGSTTLDASMPNSFVYTGTRVIGSLTGTRGVVVRACWYQFDASPVLDTAIPDWGAGLIMFVVGLAIGARLVAVMVR